MAIAVVGIFSVGVLTLTGGNGSALPVGLTAGIGGGACVMVAALLVLYGLHLIIPQLH